MDIDGKLNQMKEEIAAEFGIYNYNSIDKGELSSRMNGKIGGEMVRRLIEMGKASLENEPEKELVPILVNRNKDQKKDLQLPFEEYPPYMDDKTYFPKEYLT